MLCHERARGELTEDPVNLRRERHDPRSIERRGSRRRRSTPGYQTALNLGETLRH